MKTAYKKCIIVTASIWMACCVLLLVFYFLMVSPQQKSIIDVERNIAEKEKIVQRLRRAGAPEARAKLKKELEDQQNKLAEFMIDWADASELTFNVSEIAREIADIKAGTFASKSDGPGAEIENCEQIIEKQINVDFNSNFLGFARFLNMLERNHPIIFVDKFKIEHDRSSDMEIIDMDLAVLVKKRPGKEVVESKK